MQWGPKPKGMITHYLIVRSVPILTIHGSMSAIAMQHIRSKGNVIHDLFGAHAYSVHSGAGPHHAPHGVGDGNGALPPFPFKSTCSLHYCRKQWPIKCGHQGMRQAKS